MSWFRCKISLVPSIKIIVLSTLLAPATLITTHTTTKIHTLRPHWQMSYFEKIAQKGKISQKCRKINSIFCGLMLVLNGETWLALFGLDIERPQLFTTLNGISLGTVPSHTPRQFPAVKGSFTTVKVSRVTASIVNLFCEKTYGTMKYARIQSNWCKLQLFKQLWNLTFLTFDNDV